MIMRILLKLLIFLPPIFLVVCLYYQQPVLLEDFEAKSYDFRFSAIRGKLEPHSDVVIIAIDEQSIARLGRFPWSRDVFTRFVDKASAYGAKAVFLDVFFSEHESEKVDQAFAASLQRAGMVSLGVAVEFNDAGEVEHVTRNIPELQRASREAPYVNLIPDNDGVVRWASLILKNGDTILESYSLSAAKALLQPVSMSLNSYSIDLGNIKIPTNRNYSFLINYTGPPGVFSKYSFVDVVDEIVPVESIKDKILLVGATALGVYDMRVTPYSNNTPGVEVHASVVDSIVSERFVQRNEFHVIVDLFFIVFLGFLSSFVTLNTKNYISLPLVVAIFFGYCGLVAVAFISGHWLGFVYPAMSLMLAYSYTAYFKFFVLDKKVRLIRRMFSTYVSRHVVDQLVKDPSLAKVGGESRVVTALFSDLENYTAFSEKLPPESVVKTLNEYLSEMSTSILSHEGTLDKFMGDGIMAFWGAPLAQTDHAGHAVRCALEMIGKVNDMSKSWGCDSGDTLKVRIGINSGRSIVGNVGAESLKVEYTAIGDSVNLASRLEQINKLYKTQLIVSEHTYNLLTKDLFAARKLDFVKVVGKSCAVFIYEISGENYTWFSEYERGLELYMNRKFDEAEVIFFRLSEEENDYPSSLIYNRCLELKESPPDDDWDGSYVFLRK